MMRLIAIRHWAPVLQPFVPELVAAYCSEETQGILITELPGVPLREISIARDKTLAVYAKAGELARRLHDLGQGPWFGIPKEDGKPFDSHATDPSTHMSVALKTWYERSLQMGCLTPTERRLGEWAEHHLDVYTGEVPVAVSTDYTPGNWLVGMAGDFIGIIDLENTLYGLALDPFPRLWAQYFLECPGAEEAFISGYGTDLRAEKPLQARHLTILVGTGEVVLGLETGRQDIVARAYRARTCTGKQGRIGPSLGSRQCPSSLDPLRCRNACTPPMMRLNEIS